MKIDYRNNNTMPEACAEMCAIYYCRVHKCDENEYASIIEEYVQLHNAYKSLDGKISFIPLIIQIKKLIKKASELYLKHYDLTAMEKKSIQYVLDHLELVKRPILINRLVVMAFEATSRFPEEQNIFWE
ncbi:MAG: hypothetical protein WCH34_03235 [Bacteroidota bacterium]